MPSAGGRSARSKKLSRGFRFRPRRRVKALTYTLEADVNELPAAPVTDEEMHTPAVQAIGPLSMMARLMHHGDYVALYELECHQQRAAGVLDESPAIPLASLQSSYKHRGLQTPAGEERQNLVTASADIEAASVATRRGNQQVHTFSCCVRSLAALARRLPTKEWSRQQVRKQLLSRPTAIKLLKMAHTVRPLAGYVASTTYASYVYDQKYAKKGESRSKHRGAERVDASGDLVELVNLVYVNLMHLPLPQALGALSPREAMSISQTGPYTRSPYRVLLVLDPAVVKMKHNGLVEESMGFVKQAAFPCDLSPAHVCSRLPM